jgi:phospholipid/cholesterol/gamma-HCH transport system substrate-binding protein
MEKKINYAMVGLFIIILGAAWLAISLWLALGDFATQYTTYRVYIDESVSGLYLDAPVKYRGVEIGKVRKIELNPDVPGQVRLRLDIGSNVPIKEDTIAVLSVQGLTGIAFVDLMGGSLESPPLKAKGKEPYPVIQSGPSFFTRLDTQGTEVITNLNILFNNLADLMETGGKESLRDILQNASEITGTIVRRQEELEQGIVSAAALLENMAAASQRLDALLAQMDTTARSFDHMANRAAAASDSINDYVLSSGTGVQQFSRQTLPEFGALISELRRLADTLQAVGRKLEDDPRVLLYGRDLVLPGPGE